MFRVRWWFSPSPLSPVAVRRRGSIPGAFLFLVPVGFGRSDEKSFSIIVALSWLAMPWRRVSGNLYTGRAEDDIGMPFPSPYRRLFVTPAFRPVHFWPNLEPVQGSAS